MSEKRIQDAPLVLRLTAEKKALYRQAAEKDGYAELSPWIRRKLDEAAAAVLGAKTAARGKKGAK